MDNYLVSQILGAFGIFFGVVLPYVYDSRRFILGCKIVASFCWMVHFYLMGVPTAMLNLAMINIVNWVCFFRHRLPRGNSIIYPIVFVLINTALTLYSASGWLDLISYAATSLAMIANWQIKTRNARFLVLLFSLIWIPHNIVTGSWTALISSLLGIVSVSVAIWRFDIRHMRGGKREEVVEVV